MARAVKRVPGKRPYDSTKRQAQARATRAAIRDAAVRLFVDQGYAATPIQAIAEEAGVATQTVYAAFKTKFALLKEALEVSIVGDDEPIPLLERDEIIAINDEPDQRRRARMHAQLVSAMQHRVAPMSLVARDAAAADPEVAAFWEQGKTQRRIGMTEAARALAGSDGLRLPLDEAADVLWVICSPDVFMQFTRDKGWSVERYQRWLEDTIERTLLPWRIGDIDVVPLSDGTAVLPPAFWPGFDFERHPEVLGPDGNIHMPIGCYLVRTRDRTILLDAGMGPHDTGWGQGGDLPAQLAAAGATPSDIDTVVCTHLHVDHAGWLVDEGAPFFPRATVRYGAGDWKRFVEDAGSEDRIAEGMRLLWDAGRLDPIEGDMISLAPGLTARFTPGHTDGHYSLVISSGDERLFLLGDAVECPLQVTEDEFSALSDVDPALAKRTREAMWRELEDTDALVGAAHFPGLQVGRILTGNGKRLFS